MGHARTAPFTGVGLNLLEPPRGAQGLDVAYGSGLTTVALAERVHPGSVRGVDSAPSMVAAPKVWWGPVIELMSPPPSTSQRSAR